MIEIDKTDKLYKTLCDLGIEEEIEQEYINFGKNGITTAKELNNYLQACLGMDYVGEIDEKKLEGIEDYYKDVKANKNSSKHVTTLLNQYKDNPSQQLRTEIINSQLKNVLLIACTYKLSHIDINLNDLVQICNLGLMIAVDKYQPDSKLSFDIYVNYWILNEINKEFNNK